MCTENDSPIWANSSATHLEKIQIFQNKVLRIITNTSWFIRNENIYKGLQIVKVVTYAPY